MMDRIACRVQQDPLYRTMLEGTRIEHEHTAPDAISAAACQVAGMVGAAAIVSYTTSGATALRAARERPAAPILVLTANLGDGAPARGAVGRALRAHAATSRTSPTWCKKRRASPIARGSPNPASASSSPPGFRSARPAPPTCCASPGSTADPRLLGGIPSGAAGRATAAPSPPRSSSTPGTLPSAERARAALAALWHGRAPTARIG